MAKHDPRFRQLLAARYAREPPISDLALLAMAVCGSVVFGSLICVVLSLHIMTLRQMGVMTGLLEFSRLVVLRGSPVVLRRVLVVFRCLAVMISAFFRHGVSSFS